MKYDSSEGPTPLVHAVGYSFNDLLRRGDPIDNEFAGHMEGAFNNNVNTYAFDGNWVTHKVNWIFNTRFKWNQSAVTPVGSPGQRSITRILFFSSRRTDAQERVRHVRECCLSLSVSLRIGY